MGFLGTELSYRFLRWKYPRAEGTLMGSGEKIQAQAPERSKLELFLGPDFFSAIQGKRVADFGCGLGWECLEMAQRGAKEVIGIEIVDSSIALATRHAAERNLSDRVRFCKSIDIPVDIVHSMDAFEHFMDPASILRAMREVIHDDGEAWVTFGYTWYHPIGGHLFSVFPWAHLIFTEDVLCRWRAEFKKDGATRFGEVSGGLNQMTIRKWEQLVAESPWRIQRQTLRPIRAVGWLHNRITREFLTSTLQVILKPR